MPSVFNTFAPPGIEPGPFGTLTDDATHLAIQPPNPRQVMKFATQTFNISHHTLPILLHYLGKFKVQIFCK